eukprot:514127_1
MSETITSSFSFTPYNKIYHEWKYNKSQYYEHIMYLLLKQNPKLRFQQVKQCLQKTIDDYIHGIMEDVMLPWTASTFYKKYHEVKNKVKDDVDVVLNHFSLDNYFNSRT